MAPTIIPKWTFLIILSFLLKLIHAQQQVPCMFLFGDSQFDNGNNNDLITSAKTNYPPYGIDYSAGPTGRFSNGKNTPDFLAEILGFSRPISPFVSAINGSDILRGVNYASGAAGILDQTGVQAGARFTMNMQLINHVTTIARIRILLGNNAANDYLNRCLYVVNMGSSDYIYNYYFQVGFTPTRATFRPSLFAVVLNSVYTQQLMSLYDLGARKVAVFGLGLIGCVPQVLANFPPTNGSPCVDYINNAVQLFNDELFLVVGDLNRGFPGAPFTYVNVTNISLGQSLAGIRVTNVSCCPVLRSTGLCVRDSVPCANRNEYSFWDNIHTTESVNRATARIAYTVIRGLIQQ